MHDMENDAELEDELETSPFIRSKDPNPVVDIGEDSVGHNHGVHGSIGEDSVGHNHGVHGSIGEDSVGHNHGVHGSNSSIGMVSLDPPACASNDGEKYYTVNGQQSIGNNYNVTEHAENSAYRSDDTAVSNGIEAEHASNELPVEECCKMNNQHASEGSDVAVSSKAEGYGFAHDNEVVILDEAELHELTTDRSKDSNNGDQSDVLKHANEQLQSSQDYLFLFDSLHTKMSESYMRTHPSSLTSSTCEDALSLLSMKRSINEEIQTFNYFEFLPTELILLIFSHFLTHELCRHVTPVCRQWRQIAMDQSLWRCIDFSSFRHLTSLNLLWVVRQAPLLQKLVLRGRHNVTLAEIAIITEFCPDIRDVNLGFCQALNCDMIQCLVKNCRKLTKINVEGCEKIDSKCVRLLTRSPRLSHINFSHCCLPDSCLKFLCNNIQQLISINLDGISFTTDSVIITMANKHSQWLQDVELDGAEISDESFKYLSKCSKLKHLSVSFCECLTDEGLLYLKDLKNLEVLRLRKGTDFTVHGLIAFFQEANLSKLHSLNLSECSEITDTVVLDIVKLWGRQLRQLDLEWCWCITERGLISIVDHCCNLQVLDLLGVDKITGECLGRIPDEMPYLRFLNLEQCNMIVDSLIFDVVCRKPDLQALNYYGERFIYGENCV